MPGGRIVWPNGGLGAREFGLKAIYASLRLPAPETRVVKHPFQASRMDLMAAAMSGALKVEEPATMALAPAAAAVA